MLQAEPPPPPPPTEEEAAAKETVDSNKNSLKAVKDATHNVIVYCKANLTRRVADAIGALK